MAGIKNSEYTVEATLLGDNDLLDLTKRIATGPDVFDSQKMKGSTIKSELLKYQVGGIKSQTMYFVALTDNGTTQPLWSFDPTESGIYIIDFKVIARRTGGTSGLPGDYAAWKFASSLYANLTGPTITNSEPVDHVLKNDPGYELSFSDGVVYGTGAVDNDITWTFCVNTLKAE